MSIDIESRSSVDLTKCGVYKYAESPDFDVLLFGFSVNDGPVIVVDLASGETIPESIVAALTDDGVIKYSFNAGFERIALSAWLRCHRPDLLTGKCARCEHGSVCAGGCRSYNFFAGGGRLYESPLCAR